MRRVHVRRGGSLLLLSVLAACGGGGAGGGVPLPTIPAGPYHSVSFKGIHGAPDTVRTNVGTIVSNGTDALTDAGSTQNQNGVISADPGGPVVRYSVSLSGDLSLKDDLGTEHFRGGMILGGEMAGVAAILPFFPSEAALVLDLKKGSALSDATLDGDYHVCSFGVDAVGTHSGVVGSAAFDGLGGVGLSTVLSNSDGVITGASFTTGGYGVGADGTLSLGAGLSGGVGTGGDYAIAGGGVTAGASNATWVFIRRATGASLSSLDGTCTIVGIGYDLDDARYYDYAGTVTLDGDGHCTVYLTINREGVLSTLVDSATYTVETDGTLEFAMGGGGDILRGAISADGRLGMLGGGSTAGSDPTLAILFLR